MNTNYWTSKVWFKYEYWRGGLLLHFSLYILCIRAEIMLHGHELWADAHAISRKDFCAPIFAVSISNWIQNTICVSSAILRSGGLPYSILLCLHSFFFSFSVPLITFPHNVTPLNWLFMPEQALKLLPGMSLKIGTYLETSCDS